MNKQVKIITCTMFCLYFFIAITFPLFYIKLFLNKTLLLFDEKTFNNVIPDNIELSTSLCSFGFSKNLLDVYIKENDYFNVYILFEQKYWSSLKKDEREKIKAKITYIWKKLYKNKHGSEVLLIPNIKISNKN